MGFWVNFWDVMGWFLSAFVFVAYLVVLFSIVGDIFRDRTLKGWMKAVWIVFLVFVPFLTALVYLIARGQGMAERQAKSADNARSSAEEYIRSVAGMSPTEEITRAKALLDDGAITDAEFESLKAKVLADA